MCIQVQFSVNTFCADTDREFYSLRACKWWTLADIIVIIIKSWATFNDINCQQLYYHEFESAILPTWMAKLFYSQFVMFVYDLHAVSMITNCKIQLNGKNPHLTKPQISEWSTFDRRVKCSIIEPKEKLNRWCTGLKPHFVIKCWFGGQVLHHGMCHSEHQQFLPCERDHSLNIMTGFYYVLYNIFIIYA